MSYNSDMALRYAQSRGGGRARAQRRAGSSVRKSLWMVIVLLFVVAVGLMWFVGKTIGGGVREAENGEDESGWEQGGNEILEESGNDAETASEDVVTDSTPFANDNSVGGGYEQITLQPEGSQFGGYSATARRGADGELFALAVVADLPGIDGSAHSYEVWLVQPGVVDFFSAGTMFLREDGRFGLLWQGSLLEAEQDLFEYSEVIITREVNDGNPDPSPTHALKGQF